MSEIVFSGLFFEIVFRFDFTMLRVHQLHKTFQRTGTPNFTLSIPALSLERGQEIAIMGQSGTGKTTLFHLLAGITAPDEGSIIIHNTDITALREPQRDRFRAEHIGCVFQTFNLLAGFTALQNVLLAQTFAGHTQRTHHDHAKAMLARLGLGDKFNRYPHELSIGEQQRVAVARAIANSPSLILADEPTASVDAHNAERVIAEIRSLAHEHNAALVIITHDATIAAMLPTMIEFSSLTGEHYPK
jgi:ABC-type lipoprotein export system ATPase subunit